MAKREEKKDVILSLYKDIVREMKINDEYVSQPNIKQKIKAAKRELGLILKATKNLPRKERLAFTMQPRNLLKMLQGDDYYFTVSDGFEIYRIKKSTILRKKEDTPSYLLKRWRQNLNNEINRVRKDKELTKEKRDVKLEALGRLKVNITRNIDVVNNRMEYMYDDIDMNRLNEKAYPIFQEVTGLSIMMNI